MDLFNTEIFENQESKEIFEQLISEEIANYDVYDFVSRVAGLNLQSENQNKAVLMDTLIQHVLAKPKDYYKSDIKMSDKRFKSIIEVVNTTSLTYSIDPCESVFIQNIMFRGNNYFVFNGIDNTPAYNLQVLIRILYGFKNNFDTKYLDKVYRLISLMLLLSDSIVQSKKISLSSVNYNEEHKIIIPPGQVVKCNADLISFSYLGVEKFLGNNFPVDELFIDFDTDNVGDLYNRPFYTKPFLFNPYDEHIIILNISLIPSFILFKAIEWAKQLGFEKELLNRFNDYIWHDTKKTLNLMGHRRINEKAYGIECVEKSYYKEAIFTVYNNQLMFVLFVCDDGEKYEAKTFHEPYPNPCHGDTVNERISYFRCNMAKIGVSKEDTYFVIIVSSIGRAIGFGTRENPFGYRPIKFNPFELHCVYINEIKNKSFLPKYIRAKSQLKTMGGEFFSELNAVLIYTHNNNSFYMADDFDPDEIEVYIAPGDSIEYIKKAILAENRMLINSYKEGCSTEVSLFDKARNIYHEDIDYSDIDLAFCIPYDNILLWIKTSTISDASYIDIYYSLMDAISYWLAECKAIIEKYNFEDETCIIHIALCANANEYYYARQETMPFSQCFTYRIEGNHIYYTVKPEAFSNFNVDDNSQELILCKHILEGLGKIAINEVDYAQELNDLFRNPLRKKFYTTSFEKPYLKPLKYTCNRIVQSEDEDYLSSVIGKQLIETGQYQIGKVGEDERGKLANVVVALLYERLEKSVAEFKLDTMIEAIYHDIEETIHNLVLLERRYYSDIICYPEKEDDIIKEYNDLNRTSLALKFLIEYVTARPPKGNKYFGVSQYDELLAICAMIIDWAYKGDLFFYGIVNTPVEFLKSKRIGMKHDEFIDMYHYSDTYRRRQLKYDSSYMLRKEYSIATEDFASELEKCFVSEFGYSYTDLIRVINAMVTLNNEDVVCFDKKKFIKGKRLVLPRRI